MRTPCPSTACGLQMNSCCIFDKLAYETINNIIVPTAKEVTEDSIAMFLKERLAKYKQLKGGIVFLEALPKSATGKVLRKELRVF